MITIPPASPRSNLIPFLRWAGGKRWLINGYRELFPTFTGDYIEPFLGSGAVYFGLKIEQKSTLSDINSELIDVYIALRDQWQDVERYLKQHSKKHDHSYYYEVRASRPIKLATRAARFLYLNRTCFNGIYRVNQKGIFNVPKGTRESVMLDTDDFAKISEHLKNVDLQVSDFEPMIKKASAGDFVFVDPPYTVAHNTNGFIKYNENLFTWNDQVRLRDTLLDASERGVDFLLTNADHDSVVSLYYKEFNVRRVERKSSVASGSRFRTSVTELIVTPKIVNKL